MPPLRLLKQSDLLQKSSNTMEVFQTSRDRSVVVEASAGTGKTFALEELVLELALVERIPLQKILLVTFTEKATQELRTRLRSRLREIVDAAQSGHHAEKAGLPPFPGVWKHHDARATRRLRYSRLSALLNR